MTGFYLACAALVVVSALFYLPTLRRDKRALGDAREDNLAWYRLRAEELSEQPDESLEADARLRLLEDTGADTGAEHGDSPPARRNFPRWLLLPVVAIVAFSLYHMLGSARDVQIAERLGSLGEQTTPDDMAQLIEAIQQRSAQRPDNLHYAALLARYYMGQEDFTLALETYERILEAAPQDPQALAYAAQAEFLAAGRVLNDSSRLRAEQALAADPRQRTALGLLGMASYEEGNYRAAIAYWQRLQALEPPGSQAGQIVAGVIQQAQLALAEQGEQATEEESPAIPAGAGVAVRVALPEGAAVDPQHTVFVFARNADSESRMPIAVARLQAGELPLTLRLDDANSMAGQKLSETGRVLVSAQVSPDGRPGEAAASWVATAGPVEPSEGGEPLELLLQPR